MFFPNTDGVIFHYLSGLACTTNIREAQQTGRDSLYDFQFDVLKVKKPSP